MDDHVSIDDLVDISRGVNSPSVKRDVFAHLEDCSVCSGRYAVIRLVHEGQRIDRSRRRGFVLAGLAATVVAVAAIVAWSLSGPGDRDLAAPATADPYPHWTVELHFGNALPATTHSYESELEAGMRALTSGELQPAIETFKGLIQRRPNATELAALLGIAQYLAGSNSSEVDALLEAGSSDPRPYFGRAARWYLANLHLRRGDGRQAARVLEQLAGEEPPEYYSRLAAELLAELPSVE